MGQGSVGVGMPPGPLSRMLVGFDDLPILTFFYIHQGHIAFVRLTDVHPESVTAHPVVQIEKASEETEEENGSASEEASDDAVSASRFEYEEKITVVADYSIGHKPTVFHLAQVKNVSGEAIKAPYYAECYQGDTKLSGIYLSQNMILGTMEPDETYGIIWGFTLENETDDVRITIIDQKDPEKTVLWDQTYPISEILENHKQLPSDYNRERQLSELFDEGVITEEPYFQH